MEKLAVIKIRSEIGKSSMVKANMKVLGLRKLYSCVLVDNSPVNMGVIRGAESLLTYGEIDQPTLSKLLMRRGRISNKKKFTATEQEINAFSDSFSKNEKKLKDIGVKDIFNLHPPIKGFEKKGKKAPFSLKGAFGYRGRDINKLLERMI